MGPAQAQYDDAKAAVARMSLGQQAGQVLVQFYSGTKVDAAVERSRRLHLAGSIIMGDNVPTTADGVVNVEAMARTTRRLAAAAGQGRDWPAVIAMDQEGGLVARLGAPLTLWPTPMTYGASGDPDVARKALRSINEELAALGFTVNFAPDADVTMGAADPTIRSRSFGGEPRLVSAMTSGALQGALSSGVLPAVKHFPGHGAVTTDSHLGLPVQDASVEELKARDWKPFQRAIEAGAPMIMMGHIAVEVLDPGVPSSLSPASYQALRGLGFDGVVVTDAMNMGAVQDQYAPGDASAMALAAGADLILMPADVEAAHAAIVAGVRDGSIPRQRLNEAATRVVAMMKYQETISGPAGMDVIGSHKSVSKEASAAGLTALQGPCKGAIVEDSVRVAGGTELDQARFRAAAARHGISTGQGPLVVLLGPGASGNGDIVVSLAGPWGLAASSASTSRVALYGRTPGAFDALFAFLTGQAPAPGQLPVDVGNLPAGSGCGQPG
ncbi:MAG TPA: glycoside hydrolase family 3 N-terminal domain-containing protein [Arthrobacter sp.]|nr:glycoside hydrolase family 3 N-terminal domain-containing protein [Arthrobacter sp.]